ncbi:MAG: hypothetical protein JST00_13800 [Deltaproteobacteria bacterium]|nr:hypothetical protein [Deltaproteobacteria bacterium]
MVAGAPSSRFTPRRAGALAFALAASIFYLACDEGSSAVKEPPVGSDAGSTTDSGPGTGTDAGADANVEGGPSDCFVNPKTHLEIINACTNAVKIAKNPVLPKLLPDGGLPPLP